MYFNGNPVQAAAVGLWTAAFRDVAGATDGCAVGAVGAFTVVIYTVCLAAADGVLAGCSALPPWDVYLA